MTSSILSLSFSFSFSSFLLPPLLFLCHSILPFSSSSFLLLSPQKLHFYFFLLFFLSLFFFFSFFLFSITFSAPLCLFRLQILLNSPDLAQVSILYLKYAQLMCTCSSLFFFFFFKVVLVNVGLCRCWLLVLLRQWWLWVCLIWDRF